MILIDPVGSSPDQNSVLLTPVVPPYRTPLLSHHRRRVLLWVGVVKLLLVIAPTEIASGLLQPEGPSRTRYLAVGGRQWILSGSAGGLHLPWKFSQLGIEVVSVSERNASHPETGFKAIMNGEYVRQTSKAVRRSMLSKAKRGELINGPGPRGHSGRSRATRRLWFRTTRMRLRSSGRSNWLIPKERPRR